MSRDRVVCFLRHDTEVLFVRRMPGSGDGTAPADSPLDAISAPVTKDPTVTAHDRVADVVSCSVTLSLIRRGNPIPNGGDGSSDRTYPFLFECDARELRSAFDIPHEWIQPSEAVDRPTTPRLWEAYRTVGPTVETVRNDTEHGSAYISLRALEVLRDRAADPDSRYADLEPIAGELLDARPAMAVVRNRINRVMAAADGTPSSVRERATAACGATVEADSKAADRAASLVGDRVFTLSRSGTVLQAIETGRPEEIFLAESRPGGEGIVVAESLSSAGFDVTLLPDAAVASLLSTGTVDTVLVGADSILADGAVINKVGTHHAARAAEEFEVPCFVVCSRDKISPETDVHLDAGVASASADDGDPAEYNPTFERVPPTLFSGIVTESGTFSPDDIERVADEHAAAATWNERDAAGRGSPEKR